MKKLKLKMLFKPVVLFAVIFVLAVASCKTTQKDQSDLFNNEVKTNVKLNSSCATSTVSYLNNNETQIEIDQYCKKSLLKLKEENKSVKNNKKFLLSASEIMVQENCLSKTSTNGKSFSISHFYNIENIASKEKLIYKSDTTVSFKTPVSLSQPKKSESYNLNKIIFELIDKSNLKYKKLIIEN